MMFYLTTLLCSFFLLIDPSYASVKSVEFQGEGPYQSQLIYYPQQIDSPLPLVVISHGNGHNYKYYTYLQEELAEKGYIVMSHENETGPGIETASSSTLINTDLFLSSLDQIANGELKGKVDASRIAWIGHSRGGEGVVRAYTRLKTEDYIAKKFNISSIKLISSIAPTTFLPAVQVNPYNVNYHMFVGGADGDVYGEPYRVVMSMPIYERAVGEKYLTYVQGAGHNVFNDQSRDEGRGPNRLAREEVHKISKVVYSALLATHLKNVKKWKPYLINNWALYRLPEIPMEFRISNEYKMAKDNANIAVIDDFQKNEELGLASGGHSVTYDISDAYEGILQDSDSNFFYALTDPMNGMTRYIDQEEAPRGLSFNWDGSSFHLSYELKEEVRNFSQYEYLSLRMAQQSRHPLTLALNADLDFSIEVEDEYGQTSKISSRDYGLINQPYVRGTGWANEFNVIRIRLLDFMKVNPSLYYRIKKIRFLFGSEHGSEKGRVSIDDIQLVKWSK